jgi:hypothetical protein
VNGPDGSGYDAHKEYSVFRMMDASELARNVTPCPTSTKHSKPSLVHLAKRRSNAVTVANRRPCGVKE